MKKLFIIVFATMAFCSAFAGEPAENKGFVYDSAKVKGSCIDYTNMDTAVRPGDDFYKYATGNWIKNNPQPPIYPRWGSFQKLSDDNTVRVAGLIQDVAKESHAKGSVEQKVGDLYNLAMDSVRRNKEGAAPVKKLIKKVEKIKTREELIAYMASEQDNILWRMFIGVDDKDATRYIVTLYQGGLTLGNRDYYISEDSSSVEILNAAKEYCHNIFRLAGYGEKETKNKVSVIFDIEKRMAEAWSSKEEERDPEANYHKMSVEELGGACGNFDWANYLRNYGYDATTEVNLCQVKPVALACEILLNEPLENIKTLYEWRILNGAVSYLSDDFYKERFVLNQKMFGTEQMSERWRRSVNIVSSLMEDAVGQMFVERYFSPDSKARMLEMISNFQTVFAKRIMEQEWMSEETKKVAVDKLGAFLVKVGYPDKWDDLSALVVDPDKSFYDNAVEIGKFYFQLDKEKHYNKPVDRSQWHMPAQMVNAYYNPTTNEICFPAGILQPPFFNPEADDATNYGAIGVVIAHEMTHGFDDQGRQYDKYGNLKQWWSDADIADFEQRTKKMVDYFDSLWVIPGELKSNGQLCLGENLADHGGLNIAFDALQLSQQQHGKLPAENGFTAEQRFFLSFANLWAGVCSTQYLQYLTLNDVHSAMHLRVNGGVAQCSFWYDAFGILPGDKMYVAPEDRVRIW